MLHIALRQQRGTFTLDVNLTASTPGVIALFGRSGCGKTTLVNLLAGLSQGAQGRIVVDDQVWFDSARGVQVPAELRRIGYVFQDARLFPHYSVRGNLDYGAKRAPQPPSAARFDEVVDLLGLAPLLQRRPGGLSGGERQRVALGRALLSQPRLLLLDEPLASLDAARREDVLPWLERLRDQLQIPMVFVSHQYDEVLRLATEVLVMDDGRVVAQGDVASISLAPALRAIVGPDAIGAVLDGHIERRDTATGLADVRVGEGLLQLLCADASVGRRVRVQLRARDIILATVEPQGLSVRNQLRGTLCSISPDGDSDLIEVDIGGGTRVLSRITRSATQQLQLRPGLLLWVLVKAVSTRGHIFPAEATD